MPHGGRTVEELLAAFGSGEVDAVMLQHAIFQEETDALIGDSALDDIFGNILDEDNEEGDGDGGPSRAETESTSRTEREEDINLTGLDQQFSEEIITQVQREYFDVQTPEAFLNDFFTAFSGFAVAAAASGLGDADFEQMVNPQSGFMQQMLTEFIGEQARRALASGETPYEVVGVQGETEFLGTREGDVSSTSFRRVTRTEAEEQLRRDGVEVTEESIQQVIDEAASQAQASRESTSTDVQTTTRDTVDVESGTSEFSQDIEVFGRPQIAQVFKFSPNEFLTEKFGLVEGEEADEAALGRLSTQIRAAAPRQRPGGTGSPTTISARRT